MMIKQTLPYYVALTRIHRPVGIWLLLWPCWWGVALASPGLPNLSILLLFALGAALMRSAGCIVNDLADRDIDARVERTRSRPLASGALTPYHALSLLAFLLALSLLVVLQLHPSLLYWAAGSLILVAAYPFMKRITWWPQAFLGLTFNLGALFGWIAVTGSPDWPAIWLYIAGIAWTIGYDTIYAHQDIDDDLRIGVKSTAIRFGSHNKLYISICYAIMTTALLLAGYTSHSGIIFYLAMILICSHLLWQIIRFIPRDAARALSLFTSNQWLGLVVAVAIIADRIVA